LASSQNNSPSGKRTKNCGKSLFFLGKLTISMAIFNSKLFVYQRVFQLAIQVVSFLSGVLNFSPSSNSGNYILPSANLYKREGKYPNGSINSV
jgi:hypothetical protein